MGVGGQTRLPPHSRLLDLLFKRAAAGEVVIASQGNQVFRKRFQVCDDIFLLKEVTRLNPFGSPSQWLTLMRRLNDSQRRYFTLHGTQERWDLLLGNFRREDKANLRKYSSPTLFSLIFHSAYLDVFLSFSVVVFAFGTMSF